MLMRELGSSGIDISAVGFGAWVTGGWMWGGADDRQSIAAIHAALDEGINLIDTAPIYGYGHSEQVVGQAIRDRREQVVLATKCGLIWDREEGTLFFYADDQGATLRPVDKKIYKNLRPASIREEVERSLRNLQTDRIDLLQTHWQDPSTPLADTVAELQRLKQQGKIRAIGVSNCSLEQLKAYGPIDSDQEKYSMLDRKLESQRHPGVVPREQRLGAGLFAAGQRAVDRQAAARPAVQSGRPAQGQSPFPPGERRADQRPLAAASTDRRPARGDDRAVGHRLDGCAAGHDLRALRRPRRPTGQGERGGRKDRAFGRGDRDHGRIDPGVSSRLSFKKLKFLPTMKTVGVISDTHGLLRPEALEVLEGVDLIVHAGDIGSPEIIDALRELAPVFAIRGNVDRGIWADEFSATEIVEVDDLLLYVLHDLGQLDLDPAAAGFRVVIHGHSHDPKIAEKQGVVYLNPGSAGPRRLRLPISMARMVVGDVAGQEDHRPTSWPAQSFAFGSGAKRIGVELISLEEFG